MVPNVTGVRVEFVQATGYELAGSEEICRCHSWIPCASPLNFVWIESKEKPPRERAVNECRLDRNLSGFTRNKKTAFRRLSDDVSDWIPGASWNSASCHQCCEFDRD